METGCHMTSMQGTWRGAWLCKQGEEFLFSAQERAVFSLHWIQNEKLKVLRYVPGRNKKRVKAQGKRSKRLAKRWLSLWREFAHLEWLLGNLDEAHKVFDTGLGVAGGLEVKEAW